MDWLAALADSSKIDLLLWFLAMGAVGWSALLFARDCRAYRRWIARVESDRFDDPIPRRA
jgi:hypothetical protein